MKDITFLQYEGIGAEVKKYRDYPIVRGGVLYIAFTFSMMMLLIDIIYAFADPRIRAQYANASKKKKASKA